MSGHKERVAVSFGRAADYDRHAAMQDLAAAGLTDRVLTGRLGAGPLSEGTRGMEVGCGTGLLTRRLLPGHRFSAYLCTDLSPAMVQRCRAGFGTTKDLPGLTWAVMDAEAPAARPGLDLIVSSMALHWVQDLGRTVTGLAALLAPGGCLALAVPGPATFAEWRHALAGLDFPCGVPEFPGAAALAELAPRGFSAVVEEELHRSVHPGGLAFLRSLKATGAAVPGPGYRPLPAGSLRRALHRLEDAGGNGITITWHILYAIYRRLR